MSFRLRALALVMGIAVIATGATSWLILRQASRAIDHTLAASRAEVDLVTGELGDYGRRHGSWDGIATPVRDLAARTGQRVRVVTDSGTVLADSDVLAGRPARQVPGAPSVVDVRPTLQIPAGTLATTDLASLLKETWGAVYEYHRGLRYAACLSAAGVAVRTTPGDFGVPTFEPAVPASRIAANCTYQVDSTDDPYRTVPGDLLGQAAPCRPDADVLACLRQQFTRQIGAFAPAPLRVYLGATDDEAPHLHLASAAMVAVSVATLAIGAALLLSRHVLRPITALTRASRRLGGGDLSERVPVRGWDEMAELGRAFNRMADSLERGEERQRRMVADVAHELRTPLANLRGYLEALQDGVLPPSPELFASLHEEALLQQRIVDDLQDLALAEAGALAYHRGHTDLAELAETCRVAHAALAEAAGVTLSVRSTRPACVHGDPDRLRQVFGNLVRNALAATAPGGTVTLRVERGRQRAGIIVLDTGSGIAEDDLPHLFDRFWRADGTRGRMSGGSGLGLAIARQIVTDHGGSLTVRSRLAEGSAFTVSLPALRCGCRQPPPPLGAG